MTAIASGPRIGVVGSCQVIGLGAAFRKMWPNAGVKTWHLGPQCPDDAESIAAQLAACDLAVSQVNAPDPAAPLAFPRLRETAKRAVFVPIIVFNGFHPDCIYLKTNGALVVGPFQHLHSAIIAGGYVLGLPEARVARLFNALVYASLGYFDAFGIARDLLTASFAASGYDLASAIDGWVKQEGAFMHTLNHPRIAVLSSLAQMAAVRAGMAEADGRAEGVDDFLAHSIQWPVYPELARKLMLPKSDLVVKMASRTLERAPAHLRNLPATIGAFYEVYGKHDRAALRQAVPGRVLAGLEELLAA